MSKITAEHIKRAAYVYVRQSTLEQVQVNQESRRRQYGLAERAQRLGFAEVVVIDDDLGRSGGGIARPGFEKLIAAVGRGSVGAVPRQPRPAGDLPYRKLVSKRPATDHAQ